MKDRDFESSAPAAPPEVEAPPPPPPCGFCGQPAHAADTGCVDAWAAIRGDVDPSTKVGAPVAFSQHKAWRFLCAKALRGWAKHQVVTGDEYDAAVKAATDDLQVK